VLKDVVDVQMSDGRLFHARGPATANARSPVVGSLEYINRRWDG